MIRTLIVEDENLAAERLTRLIGEIEPSIQIVGRTDSIESTVHWLSTNPHPDLIFLDIQLGDGLSFEIFRKIQLNSHTIVVTAFDDYAIKAFEINSIGYVLKPVNPEKLRIAINKFIQLRSQTKHIDMNLLIEMLGSKPTNYKKRFTINIADRIKIIDIQQVALFYSKEKYTFCVTYDDHTYPLEYSLDQLEELIDPTLFFRINRQFIVSEKAITKIRLLSKSRIAIEVFPGFGGTLDVSGSKTNPFRKWLEK